MEGGNTLLIESNRKIAASQLLESLPNTSGPTDPLNNTFQTSNAQWNTQIESGIALHPGDQISMEYAALNIPGLGDSMIEFKGRVDIRDGDTNDFRKDNETNIDYEFYITNRMEFTFPLPLAHMRLRRELYVSTYGTPSLDGRQFGDGFHKSGDNDYTGETAGLEAFTASYPYRAIPGINWSKWDKDEQKFMNPRVIVSTQFQTTYGTGQHYAQRTPFVRGSYKLSEPSSDRLYVPTIIPIGNDSVLCPFMDFETSANGGALMKSIANQWVAKTQSVEYKLRTGNSTPARIGEILSTQMKSRELGIDGGAYQWILKDVEPGSYNWSPPIGTTLPLTGVVYSFSSGNNWTSLNPAEVFNFTDEIGTRPNGFAYDFKYNRINPASNNIVYLQTTGADGLSGNAQFDNNTSTPVWSGTWTMDLTGGTGGLPKITLVSSFTEDFTAAQALTTRQNSTTKRKLTFTPTNSVGGKTYQTLHTSTGYLLERHYLKDLYPNALNKWSSEFDFESGDDDVSSKSGLGYNTPEAFRAIYNNLLCGNPEQWSTATSLLPLFQFQSLPTDQITATGFPPGIGQPVGTFSIPFIWTGNTSIATQSRGTGVPALNVGEYGNHPRIKNLVTDNGTRPSFKILNPIGNYPTGSDVKFSWTYRAEVPMQFHDIQNYEVIVSTLMYRGGATTSDLSSILLRQMEISNNQLIRYITTPNSAPITNSSAYYDSAYVDWIVGKIDDELSYPQAEVDGIPGVNVFLSNDYLTRLWANGAGSGNQLFNGVNSVTCDTTGSTTNNGFYIRVPVAPNKQTGTSVETITWCSYNYSQAETTGYPNLGFNNEAAQRNVRVFRYNPHPPTVTDLPITPENLFNERCTWLVGPEIGATKRYRFRPPSLTYQQYYNEIWLPNISTMNDGKGNGMLPIFDYFQPNFFLKNEPYLCVIALPNAQRQFPYPYEGEYFFPASPSFMQNMLAIPVSTQKTDQNSYIQPNTSYPSSLIDNTDGNATYRYANALFCGANDPLIEFDDKFTRFSISKLHTSSFRGNGPFNRMDINGGNSDADSVVMTTDSRPAAISRLDRPNSKVGGTANVPVIFDPLNSAAANQDIVNLIAFNDITAQIKPYTVMSTQGGVAIGSISIPRQNGVALTLSPWDMRRFEQTLFNKLGFQLNQLLPLAGRRQTQFNSHSHNENFGVEFPLGPQYNNQVKPVTTNAYVSSSEQPSFVVGFGALQLATTDPITSADIQYPLPAYNLGINYRNSATQANSDQLLAFNLPNKLTFPYLVCYSNIQTPCGSQYIGSANGKQSLSAISYLSTNYSVSDFAYSFRSDLVFTVTRPYILSEIVTSIHFPTGELAETILGPNSAIIYRIDFAKRPIPLHIAETKHKEKKEEHNEDK